MLIGYHVSTAGGLYRAFAEAEAIGCNIMQISIGSPQVWHTPKLSNAAAAKFKGTWQTSSIQQVLVHSSYLPNLASHKATLRGLSLRKMKEEIKAAYLIGANGYNFHCGSNQHSNAEGVRLATETLNRLAELTDPWPVQLIIENDAGAGNRIGDTIEELAQIWKRLKNKSRFGFCLDTCHLFVSGVDVRTPKAIRALLRQFNKLIGFPHLKFIHINDALFPFGSRRDRHAHIGRGHIGREGFKYLLHTSKLRHLPFIMETPYTGESKADIATRSRELRMVKRLAK